MVGGGWVDAGGGVRDTDGAIRGINRCFTRTGQAARFVPFPISKTQKRPVAHPKEIPVTPELESDTKAVELLRYWVNSNGRSTALLDQHSRPKDMPEFALWGLVLADLVRHISAAYPDEALAPKIAAMMLSDLNTPANPLDKQVKLEHITALVGLIEGEKRGDPGAPKH